MNSWLELLNKADKKFHGVEDLKRELSILFLLEQHGHTLSEVAGKYVTRCPFHTDGNPSLDVFGAALERWGCYPCGIGGDVLDLVERLTDIPKFVDRKDYAAGMIREQQRVGWSGPTKGADKAWDQDAANRLILSSAAEEIPMAWVNVYEELAARNPGLDSSDMDDLRTWFRIGAHGTHAIVPYYDREMTLIAYKRRAVGESIMAAAGANFKDILYGEWLDDDDSKTVVLCEGESDTWAAWHALDDYAVLGLPTGAGAFPSQAYRLVDRDVILAFDGDETGRKALVAWVPALQAAGASSVRVVVMPDRLDLASALNIPELIAGSQPILTIPNIIVPHDDGLYRAPKSDKDEKGTALSNWVFVPQRQLLGTDGDAWEGTLLPHNKPVVLTTSDMSTKSKLVAWSSKHGGSWYGTDSDCQHLQASLQAIRPYLATGHTSTVAGLHDGHFIYPGDSIGPDYWVYEPGVGGVELERYTSGLVSGDFGFVEQLLALRTLHRPDIMDPILAWLAIAPLRSLIDPFPTLAVLGASGTGKTTIVEQVLEQITGTCISINLTSTTQHAIHSFVGCTNAFPVHFDEYRPGAGQKAIEVIDQIVRDAYNGKGSAKGGMGSHWSEVRTLTAEAPLIVSGEDAFTETSHVDRIVPVYLTPAGRNPEALELVKRFGVNGWAKNWLELLHTGLATGDMPRLEVIPEEHSLQPRMQHNLGVLRLGWDLLQFFAQREGKDLPDPDFSGVIAAWTKEQKGNPILDALRWCLGEPDAAEFLKLDQEHNTLYVRSINFVAYVNKHKTFTLPGKHKAVSNYFVDHLEGVSMRKSFMNQQAWCIAIPLSTIEQDPS